MHIYIYIIYIYIYDIYNIYTNKINKMKEFKINAIFVFATIKRKNTYEFTIGKVKNVLIN